MLRKILRRLVLLIPFMGKGTFYVICLPDTVSPSAITYDRVKFESFNVDNRCNRFSMALMFVCFVLFLFFVFVSSLTPRFFLRQRFLPNKLHQTLLCNCFYIYYTSFDVYEAKFGGVV